MTRHRHPNGEEMTNEQTIHRTMLQAHEKRRKYETMEKMTLHSDLTGTCDTTLITFTTDEHGRITTPCDGLMLVTYLRDRVITFSASKLHPTTDNWILPAENLHIKRQTYASLHGREDDIDRS